MTLKKDNKLYDAQSMTEAKRTEKKLDRNHTKMLLVLKKKTGSITVEKKLLLILQIIQERQPTHDSYSCRSKDELMYYIHN